MYRHYTKYTKLCYKSTKLFSEWYVSPVLSGMDCFSKPWFVLNILNKKFAQTKKKEKTVVLYSGRNFCNPDFGNNAIKYVIILQIRVENSLFIMEGRLLFQNLENTVEKYKYRTMQKLCIYFGTLFFQVCFNSFNNNKNAIDILSWK